MRKTSNKRVVDYPTRVSYVTEVTPIRSFTSDNDGATMYGTNVTLANGDTFGFWNADRYTVEMFSPGVSMIYELQKEIYNEGTPNQSVKMRLRTHQFIVPIAQRFETYAPGKIADSITLAMAYAKDMVVAGTIKLDELENIADRMQSWMSRKVLTQGFELEGNYMELKIENNAGKDKAGAEAGHTGGDVPSEPGVQEERKSGKGLGGGKPRVQKG
jgi:hypothetical protein